MKKLIVPADTPPSMRRLAERIEERPKTDRFWASLVILGLVATVSAAYYKAIEGNGDAFIANATIVLWIWIAHTNYRAFKSIQQHVKWWEDFSQVQADLLHELTVPKPRDHEKWN
jgi:hypothetical protein